MPYQATVVKVMIASPADVVTERDIARRVILDWNFVHSEDRLIVLMPVGWDTHASPSMEGPAQDVINRQVLEDCDLLVAIFWTRLGSPTASASSGTVEEINRHIEAEKPAMLYFSNAPAHPDSVDEDQIRALRVFRDECRRRGLIATFDSRSDFHDLFARQLGQTVIRCFGSLDARLITADAPPSRSSLGLSDAARELLLAAVEEASGGNILQLKVMQGTFVQTGSRALNDPNSHRDTARWVGALEELERLGLVRAEGFSREAFSVTHEGYEQADILRTQQ
jgi:hypothetical protein